VIIRGHLLPIAGPVVALLLTAAAPIWPDESLSPSGPASNSTSPEAPKPDERVEVPGVATPQKIGMMVSQEADHYPGGRWVFHYGREGRFGIQKIWSEGLAVELDFFGGQGPRHTRFYLGTSRIQVPVHPTIVSVILGVIALGGALVPVLVFVRNRKEA